MKRGWWFWILFVALGVGLIAGFVDLKEKSNARTTLSHEQMLNLRAMTACLDRAENPKKECSHILQLIQRQSELER